MPKAERLFEKLLAEKRSFEGKCEVLRTIFQPRALSSDVPASRKGFFFFQFITLRSISQGNDGPLI